MHSNLQVILGMPLGTMEQLGEHFENPLTWWEQENTMSTPLTHLHPHPHPHEQIWLPSLWKNETIKAPRIKGSILKFKVPPLGPNYIAERRTTFTKTYGIKVRCYWELFEEHVWNLGTVCLRPPPPHDKGALHDTSSHWLHGNYIPKISRHFFWP